MRPRRDQVLESVRDDLAEFLVGRNFPVEPDAHRVDPAVAARRIDHETAPDHEAIRIRITRRDAERERSGVEARAFLRMRGRCGTRQAERGAGPEELATVKHR
jgi:hypothetical protein